MATIQIPAYYNLKHIANLAGSFDNSFWSYENGNFYVNDVTQEALDNALHEYNINRPFFIKKINRSAEICRKLYITEGEGQSYTYLEKMKEAQCYINAGCPSDTHTYVFLTEEATAYNDTVENVANLIIQRYNEKKVILARIERIRRDGILKIQSAISKEEAQQYTDSIIKQFQEL
jgi:isochorismate synthase EntC